MSLISAGWKTRLFVNCSGLKKS